MGKIEDYVSHQIPVMTLREWYAGQALAGLCAAKKGSGFGYSELPEIARVIAGIMIDEIEAEKNQ